MYFKGDLTTHFTHMIGEDFSFKVTSYTSIYFYNIYVEKGI